MNLYYYILKYIMDTIDLAYNVLLYGCNGKFLYVCSS